MQNTEVTGFRVQRGFSGGAVWDTSLNGVVGMVVAEETDPAPRVAYMIPTSLLIQAWPALKQRIVSVPGAEGDNVSERHDFYKHILPSRNYVKREEVLAHVRTELLADIPVVALTSALEYNKPNALHGMGGIGKTVIARALCDDLAVQSAFPDGILWVTLGQEPELSNALRGLVNSLFRNIGTYSDIAH